MATSRSADVNKTCRASAAIYSGRADPVWEVSASEAAALEEIWDQLSPSGRELPTPPALGYRGASLDCQPHEQWLAYGGVVTHVTGRAKEHRIDEQRRFERALLNTAPRGLLPLGLF